MILVSDTSMIGRDIPSITTGLRGLASHKQVELVRTLIYIPVFSGSGGEPDNVLCKLLPICRRKGTYHDPRFYDDVLEVLPRNVRRWPGCPFNLENYKKSLDIKEVKGEEGFTTNERTGIRPTLICLWNLGGYTGEGAKTVLPSKAYAKISCRLVPNQNTRRLRNCSRNISSRSLRLREGEVDLPAWRTFTCAR